MILERRPPRNKPGKKSEKKAGDWRTLQEDAAARSCWGFPTLEESCDRLMM